MDWRLTLIYIEAWLFVGIAYLTAIVCIRNVIRTVDPRNFQRLLQAIASAWVATVYTLQLLGWIRFFAWAELSTPGFLVLMASLLAREWISRRR